MIIKEEKDKQIIEKSSETINIEDKNTINTISELNQKEELNIVSNLNNINPDLNKKNNIYRSYNFDNTTIGKHYKNNQQFIIENNGFSYTYNNINIKDLKSFHTNENKEIDNIKNNNVETNNNPLHIKNSEANELPVNIIEGDKTNNIDGKINNSVQKEYYKDKDDRCKICCEKFWGMFCKICNVLLIILLFLYGIFLIILFIISILSCSCQGVLTCLGSLVNYIEDLSNLEKGCDYCGCANCCYNCYKSCKFKFLNLK